MRRYASWVLRYRTVFAFALVVALAASVWALPRLSLDFSITSLLHASSEDRRELAAFEAALPGDNPDAVIVVSWGRPMIPSDLDTLAHLAHAIRSLSGISRVVSLSDIRVIRDGTPLPTVHGFSSLVASRGDQSVLDTARDHPLVLGSLLARDGTASALICTCTHPTLCDDSLKNIERIVTSAAPPATVVRILGSSIIDRAMSDSMNRNILQSGLLQLLCCVFVLAFLFRRVLGVVVPLLSVVVAVLLYVGATVALGDSITLIEITVPGLILIIGLCDAIHMVHRFEEARAGGHDRRTAIVQMMTSVGTACLFTSLTTAIGFLGLLSADHKAVRDFAWSSSMGIAIGFVAVITVIPLLLSIWPTQRKRDHRPLARLSLTYGRPRLTSALVAFVLALSLWGIARMDIQSSWLEELPTNSDVVKDMHWYERHFDGFLKLDVHVHGILDDPAVYHSLRALETYILAEPEVTRVDSYTRWIDEFLGHSNEPSDEQLLGAIELMKLSGAAFPTHIITPDFRRARLRFRGYDVSTRRYLSLMATVTEHAHMLPANVTAEVGGSSRLSVESTTHLVEITLHSLLVSLVLITVLMALLFRSARMALISVLPNALPVLLGLGLAGWLDIPLRLGIIMIFSLGLGLAVDDSIHLITRYRQEQHARPDTPTRQLLHDSLHTSGRALITTSIVLAFGTLCYLPASFKSLEEIGILLTTIIVTALVTNLFVLPHLLEHFDNRNDQASKKSANA